MVKMRKRVDNDVKCQGIILDLSLTLKKKKTVLLPDLKAHIFLYFYCNVFVAVLYSSFFFPLVFDSPKSRQSLCLTKVRFNCQRRGPSKSKIGLVFCLDV